MGGYAGTGKTTLIAYLRQALYTNDPDAEVAYCAFTGKAARVLDMSLRRHKVPRRKDFLGTLHSLLYNAKTDKNGHISGWVKKDELDYDLIIVDEASMVSEELWNDLLSFDIPVLAIGDHGQLPPIGSSFNLMANPIIRLERIFRQEATSGIIEVATMARKVGQIPRGEYGKDVKKLDRASDNISIEMEELLESWRPSWMVLCGYNHTRVRLNNELRMRMGFESPDPTLGDQVVCLRNNRTAKLYNGMLGTIIDIRPAEDDPDGLWWSAVIQLNDRKEPYGGFILREQFGARETVKQVPNTPIKKQRGDLFDFGYALTVHKAQGSSATTVLVFEERSKHMNDDDWRRWLYTAVTRAEEELFIVG